MPIGAATSGTACRPGATILHAGAKTTAGCRMSAAGSRRAATEAVVCISAGNICLAGGDWAWERAARVADTASHRLRRRVIIRAGCTTRPRTTAGGRGGGDELGLGGGPDEHGG